MKISGQVGFTQNFDNVLSQKALKMSKSDFHKMKDKKMREVSKEFAALFIDELYKSMRKTVAKDKMLGGGKQVGAFKDMLYYEYARMTARADGTGIGKMIYDFLKRK